MLEFIVDHYLIILIVSLFLIFALIGYIIDSIRNRKRNETTNQILETSQEIPDVVVESEIIEVEDVVSEEIPESPNTEVVEPVLEVEPEEPEPQNLENLIPEVDEPEDNS